jgi:hypothetical protein
MKSSILFFLTLSIFLLFACHNKESYGGRMLINPETDAVTPLNQECCYYLAYESLCNNNSTEAQAYLKQLETFPQPPEKKLILEEGVKTLWALSYLQEKKYEEAIVFMRQLKKVDAITANQYDINDQRTYRQLRRLRSSSMQLRKSLPALEEYFVRKQKNSLKPAIYNDLKQAWRVELQVQKYTSVHDYAYPFPPIN